MKEHSVALNTRPRAFYRELRRIPAVRLISPFADNFKLISGADLVVTVTGTAAYEASLLGQPAASNRNGDSSGTDWSHILDSIHTGSP